MNKYLEKLAGMADVAGRFAMNMGHHGVKGPGVSQAGTNLIEKVRRGSIMNGKRFGLTGPNRNKALTTAPNKATIGLNGSTPAAKGLQQSFK